MLMDVFVIDSAHGHSKNVIDTIKTIKKEFSTLILLEETWQLLMVL